jgi:hypothetical protein
VSDFDYWTHKKIAELKNRKDAMFAAFRREYPGLVGELLCRGLQSVYWNDGYTAAEKAMDQIDAASSEAVAQ